MKRKGVVNYSECWQTFVVTVSCKDGISKGACHMHVAKSHSFKIQAFFVNHRAKRGGSLFQGGSGEGERSRSDLQVAVGSPSVRQFSR